jgi:SAM-dependent methyltransferase
MPDDRGAALAEVRSILLDADHLIRAVAAGRRRGATGAPSRAELRPVELKAGRHLQYVTSDGNRPTTRNLPLGPPAEELVDELLAAPYGNWHVETTGVTLQLRITKRGEAQVHRSAPVQGSTAGHDRAKQHLLAPDDPLFAVVGGTAAKRRQVDAFLRALDATVDDGLRTVVDLGCGNAYLTFAAYRYLAARGYDVQVTGVDVREDQRDRNTALAEQLGCAGDVTFVAGTIADAELDRRPDLVLALHACDTATDDALERAVRGGARWILAAPCCHHDIAAQLRNTAAPRPYQMMIKHGILRERFADTLTDTLRAAILRAHGYRVDVVEFVDSKHTPRNTLLRATKTDAAKVDQAALDEYRELRDFWQVVPHLEKALTARSGGRTPR